jgi:hypothetical protein
MKVFIVALVLWIFVVPGAVALSRIFMYLVGFEPHYYFVLGAIVIALVTLTIMRRPFGIRQSS